MPDPTDFAQLRTAVHEVCREANKGIFNHLEGVLLRLVDAVEAGNNAGHEHNPDVAKWIAAATVSTEPDAYADRLRAVNSRLSSLGGKPE